LEILPEFGIQCLTQKNHKLTRPKKKKMHSNMRTKSNSNPSKRSRAQTRKESKLPLSLKKTSMANEELKHKQE
jgi:hypothetical protein